MPLAIAPVSTHPPGLPLRRSRKASLPARTLAEYPLVDRCLYVLLSHNDRRGNAKNRGYSDKVLVIHRPHANLPPSEPQHTEQIQHAP
jgi:hypothetical protein